MMSTTDSPQNTSNGNNYHLTGKTGWMDSNLRDFHGREMELNFSAADDESAKEISNKKSLEFLRENQEYAPRRDAPRPGDPIIRAIFTLEKDGITIASNMCV